MIYVEDIKVYDKTCQECIMTESEVLITVKTDLGNHDFLLSRIQVDNLIDQLNKSIEPNPIENLFK